MPRGWALKQRQPLCCLALIEYNHFKSRDLASGTRKSSYHSRIDLVAQPMLDP